MTTKSLRDTGAIAATAVAAHPDRELLDLSAALATARDEYRNLDDAHPDSKESDAAFDRVLAIQHRIIDTPAQTAVGLAIKMRIVQSDVDQRLVLPKPSDGRSLHDPIEWGVANVLWDAERLAGQAGDETLAALWAKHVALRDDVLPDDVVDVDARDQYVDKVADQMTAVEAEILATPATTIAGARVHIALLAWLHVEGATPHALKPHLKRLAGDGGAS